MSGKDLGFVGTDPGRLERAQRVLGADGMAVSIVLATPGEAMTRASEAPHVVLLDTVGQSAEQAIAGVALLDAAWPSAGTVVLHDDADPATIRAVLDAGALSIVTSETSDGQLTATVSAASQGHGLIDVAIVRPVIDLYANLHAETRRRNRAVIESLAAAVEAKDTVTSRHLRAVSRLATQLAAEVEPDLLRSDDFLYGCLLHDVGKIGVPERILTKPGALTADEWEVMRRHPQTGARVVRPLGLDPMVTDVVLHHHERWDGAGYPERLGGDEIPLAARVFSVCDALEAMTANRPYRRALPMSVAYERVRLEAGHQFDPEVVGALTAGVQRGTIELEEAGGLDVEQPARRRISSAVL